MSHRRKSARPTNKLRRTAASASSLSSDSDVDHCSKVGHSRHAVAIHGGCFPTATVYSSSFFTFTGDQLFFFYVEVFGVGEGGGQ